jgi:hypothetical protein
MDTFEADAGLLGKSTPLLVPAGNGRERADPFARIGDPLRP